MTTDAYWDELGVAWVAIEPDRHTLAPRLKSRLRRQSRLILAGLGSAVALGIAGLAIGLATLWIGWNGGAWHLITRGIAILMVSAMLAVAIRTMAPVSASDNVRALSEMIELSIARATRTLMTIRLGFYACAATAALGLAGTAIRSWLSRPPTMSPLVDLALLALFAAALFVCRRRVRTDLAKFEYLKRALDVDQA